MSRGMDEESNRVRIPATTPPLRHRVAIGPPARGRPTAYKGRIVGTPDALYTAVGDGASTIVSHFRDGKMAWSSTVGLANPGFVRLVGDRVLVSTYDLKSAVAFSEVDALDAESGRVVWSRRSSRLATVRSEGNRWFFETGDDRWTGFDSVIEFDPSTGVELNRFMSRIRLEGVTLGYAMYDQRDGTAQLVGFDLGPTGRTVSLAANGVWYFDRDELGWIDATGAGAVGSSPEGDLQFRCVTTIGASDRDWDGFYRIDENTVAVMATDAIEVFDVSSGEGTSLWGLAAESVGLRDSDIDVDHHDAQLVCTTFPTDPNGTVERWGVGARVDVLDWRTGEVIATGTDQLILDDHGQTVTHEGDAVVARELGSGQELWRIPASPSAELSVLGSAILVITATGDTATLDVYSDDPDPQRS